MRVCVVGGTGNISASFVPLLVQLGHEVTCFNRGRTGAPPEGVRVIQGDRHDRAAFEAAMQAERFDAAIDMICYTREDAESSLRAFRGVEHFVHCSTVCTYGVQFDWLPVTEDHPLRPISDYARNKVAADSVFLAAYHDHGFPVTIIKPSITYGPGQGAALRQIAWESGWVDRIRKGKPIVICGDGNALHQFMYVDDAAPAFACVLGRSHTIGQTYNMVRRGFTSWAEYHRTAMRILKREVELVGVSLADLERLNVPNFGICRDIFAHHGLYSSEKLFRDVPEFRPRIPLEEGLARTIEALDRMGKIPNSDDETWEDEIVQRHRRMHE